MILCPSRPKSLKKEETELCKFSTHALEPVGEGYWEYLSRMRLGLSLAKDLELREAIETVEEETEQVNDDNDDEFINSLDPKDCKEQDHYLVLGCLKRFAATDDDLKRAYRKRVLRYHPDKTDNPANDSAFKCIQKAWELLSDQKRRREWDSVDPTFDERIPSAKAKGEFFSLYAPVFEKESRFSKNLPVPVLGGLNDSRDAVETFYEFWFSFESWRSFEALDEEDANAGECREEKRWIERKNKAQRNKMKKEDVSRIARLVDQAFSIDPRIKKFKQEDKEAKEAKKNQKNAAQNAAKEALLAQQEAERLEKERLEAFEKEQAAADKKQREASKNALRKEKKSIKRILTAHDYFLESSGPTQIEIQLNKLEDIFSVYESEQLAVFRSKLESNVSFGKEMLSTIFDEEHLTIAEQKNAGTTSASVGSKSGKTESVDEKERPWTAKETATLIKAVKLFPGGSLDRWTRIADYVNEHGQEEGSNGAPRSAKQIINYSKQVQQAAASEREKLQASFKTETKENTAAVSENDPKTKDATAASRWTSEQQSALEKALVTFPASLFKKNPASRWDKVAEVVPGKTVTQVKARVKELSELKSMKRHILAWMAVFIVVFVPLWWSTTAVYRATLPFDQMNNIRQVKCKVEIQLQYPSTMTGLENQLSQTLASSDLDFSFGKGTNHYNLEIECGEHAQVRVLVTAGRRVLVSIPNQSCTVENARDILSDTILDLFDSKASEDDLMKMFKFSENYQVTWSLLNGDPRDTYITWDIARAIEEYFSPIQRLIGPLFSLEFGSQIQNYAELPIKVEEYNDMHIIRQEALPQFINSAEWNLVPVASISPPVNFVIYVPGKRFRPLNIVLSDGSFSKTNAFLIPRWGGVVLGNVPDSSSVNLDSKTLEPYMQLFLTQLRVLLGIRDVNCFRLAKRNDVLVEVQKSLDTGITLLELDRLLRERTMQNIADAYSTLASLSRLIKNLPNMIVQDHIQTQVLESLDYLEKARNYLAENNLEAAAVNGRQAVVSAEAAFSDKSMVSLLYFPSEHVLAIYMPFFLPIALPLFKAYKEQYLRWKDLRKSKVQ